ncbi:MAG: membrane protein insertase YidC [Candidatus Magasanikbacteria bacterium]|nr:membrane protein insertase YidC [Candidatus Magasanikbacteria bacterium]
MLSLFHVVLYQPIFNVFVFLYNVLPGHDVGLVILAITILVRLVLYPLTSASIKSQRSLQDLQPKMAAIKLQYPDDKQKQTQAIMEMYKNNKVNPLASCLPVLIQLPILIALYKVLQDGLHSKNLADSLYSFVANPGSINQISLHFFNMAKPNYVLAVLAGLAQYFQAKTLSRKNPPLQAGEGSKDEAMMSMMNKQMLYFMPVMTVLIGLNLPAGLTLYWFFGTLLMALQQIWLFKNHDAQKGGVIEGQIVK